MRWNSKRRRSGEGRGDGLKPGLAGSTGPSIGGVRMVLTSVLSNFFTIKFIYIRHVLTNSLVIKAIGYMALKLLDKLQGMANGKSQGASPKRMTLFITRRFTHNEKREQKCA